MYGHFKPTQKNISWFSVIWLIVESLFSRHLCKKSWHYSKYFKIPNVAISLKLFTICPILVRRTVVRVLLLHHDQGNPLNSETVWTWDFWLKSKFLNLYILMCLALSYSWTATRPGLQLNIPNQILSVYKKAGLQFLATFYLYSASIIRVIPWRFIN